ncbi:IS110 family transposase [Tetzosporium hominis]|uniref:IS110 family transposase n=1 Tax=Tetzosporium hominis TaxID=2020506 RepID=A0A264W158_9BACL|nr:IS110 family transposase [Tetzosporium hominis]OZS77328.1 IS110 family transposase [Tetzosporium hominis]
MNRNMNNRINQVDENTLVIGIDIAKKLHYACAMDDRGRVLKKSFGLSQDLEGFQKLLTEIQALMSQFAKSQVVVGFEPTGHYWMNLSAFLVEAEIPFVMVNPMHVNRTKELDDNSQTKNDKKDARVIASLIRDGRFSFPRILQGVDAELRTGNNNRKALKKEMVAIQNRMIRWIDIYFPEFSTIFKSFGKVACELLEHTPFPSDLTRISEAEMIQIYEDNPAVHTVPKKKLILLREKASVSIGVRESQETARFEIRRLVRNYKQCLQDLEVLEERLIDLAKQLPDFEYITSIRGIGENTAVEILAEVGPLSNYQHPEQIKKLAGLSLRENSSGQHTGKKSITKRGRSSLRATLYKTILPLISNNKTFRELYDYYTKRQDNPLKNKQAMVVLCGKLIKIIHALCTKRRQFDAEKMMRDIHSLLPAA